MSQYDYITLVSEPDWKLVAIIPNSTPTSPKTTPIPSSISPPIPPIIQTNEQVSFNSTVPHNTMRLDPNPPFRLTTRSNKRKGGLLRSGHRTSISQTQVSVHH